MRLHRLLAISLLALCPGCPRGNSISVGPSTYLPASTEGYNVDRVALGASLAAVHSALGDPALRPPGDERWTFKPTPDVFFRKDGAVFRVQGTSLRRGDVVLVPEGATEAEVIATLGVGWVEEHYKPKQAGGGMITTSSEFIGKDYRYRDDVGTFSVWIVDGRVRSVSSEVGWPKRAREPKRPR